MISFCYSLVAFYYLLGKNLLTIKRIIAIPSNDAAIIPLKEMIEPIRLPKNASPKIVPRIPGRTAVKSHINNTGML